SLVTVTPWGVSLDPLPGLAAAVLPVDVAVNGSQVAIAAAGASSVIVIDSAAGAFDAGAGSQVQTFPFEGQPVAVAYLNGALFTYLREPATFVEVVADPRFARKFVMGTRSTASTGFDLFHTATAANIACASCHPEATDDGNVWTLPEGKFRTP